MDKAELKQLGQDVYNFYKDCISLTDGSLIVEDTTNKYCTGLTFVINDVLSAAMFYEAFTGHIPDPNFQYPKGYEGITFSKSYFNLGSGFVNALPGKYFVTKKNTQCFEIQLGPNTPELLLIDEWGGSYNNYKGHVLEKLLLCDNERDLWNLRMESKKGGEGVDYIIIPKDMKYEISLEDL